MPSILRSAISWLALASLFIPANAKTEYQTVLEQSYADLNQIERESISDHPAQRKKEISTAYSRLFRDLSRHESMANMSSIEIDFLIKATNIVLVHTRDEGYLRIWQDAYTELERRGAATDAQRADWYRALVGMRKLQPARELLQQHPQLEVEAIPQIKPSATPDPRLPLAYATTGDPTILQEVRLSVGQGIHLIVVAHPLCAFSRRATLALEQDPVLAPILDKHALWLAPADGQFYAQVINDWNAAHPGAQIHITHDPRQWPQVEDWATPTFHLLRDGVRVGSVSGWPREGNREALLALWRSVEAMPAPASSPEK